ncbi:unnamed protein product [Eruca vesicaria subsp. sativa]|uniref:Uncharacterized protein n=1 Tax=Eruca vesicaria subsp. sativa TaxID=29727 RepID=A0ABC8M393_ERUVS|nr:unnamed protein product [Eruca vesicaria subsp. sativa]
MGGTGRGTVKGYGKEDINRICDVVLRYLNMSRMETKENHQDSEADLRAQFTTSLIKPSKAHSVSLREEQGPSELDRVSEEGKNLGVDSGLGVEGTMVDNTRKENEEEFLDGIQQVSDGDFDGDTKMHEFASDVLEEENEVEEREGKNNSTDEAAKRHGLRRKPTKATMAAGASNKLKMAQMLANKLPVTKAGMRHGDHTKQAEDKGPLNRK